MSLSDKLKRAATILHAKALEDYDLSQCMGLQATKDMLEKEALEMDLLAHDLNEIAKRMDAENIAL